MRLHIIRNVIILLFIAVAAGLVYLQVIRGGYFFRQSESNSIRIIPFEGKRGRILDRNGKVLADNKKDLCVALIAREQKGKKDVFRFLADVVELDAKVLEARFSKNRTSPFAPVVLVEDISRQQAIIIEENAYRYPGLLVLEKYARRYPAGAASGHILGYVGKADEAKMDIVRQYGYSADDLIGYSGVEEYYDARLRGIPGGRQIQVDSRGQQVRLLSVRAAKAGEDLTLAVDQDIQRAAYQALDGRRGAVVVLDPANGEVLGLVSSPSFDPGDFSARGERSRVADYLKSGDSPLLNRALSARFPPGSVFKAVVALAGLEERKFKPGTTYDCPGFFDLGDRRFTFAHAYGAQDFIQAMGHSANEYFFHIGLALGVDQISRYAAQFGLGELTGIDLPYEAKGTIPHRRAFSRWFAGDTANMSIGQGYVLTTPIQLARLMAMIESEGQLVTPHLVTCTANSRSVCISGTNVRRVPLRPEVWRATKQALRAVVKMPSGTAHELNMPGIEVYGKTGTAQAGAEKSDHSWFAGVAVTPKRTFAFAFLLEHGGSSSAACLAARNMLLDLQQQGKI